MDPAVLDGLAEQREVILFNNAGVASSSGGTPTTFGAMAKNAEAFIEALGLPQIDLLGFSIGGMVAQQITLDRPELVRRLVLVGTAPRDHDAGEGQGHITPETALIFGATCGPPENYGSNSSSLLQRGAKARAVHFFNATCRDRSIATLRSTRKSPCSDRGGRPVGRPERGSVRLSQRHQAPTLVVSGNHDVIVYTVNSLHLGQNLPNAKLILYPDANHGSWYDFHDDFVFETNRFLNS